MDVKLSKPLNAPTPMDVTEHGIVTEAKPLQPVKAYASITLTLFPSVKLVKPLQPEYLQLVVYQFVLSRTVEKWRCKFHEDKTSWKFNVFNYFKLI